MEAVGKDIVKLEVPESTMKDLLDPFYQIMEKHGIKWATEENDGRRTGASYPWTMAKNHFILSMVQEIEWAMVMNLFGDEGETDEIQS